MRPGGGMPLRVRLREGLGLATRRCARGTRPALNAAPQAKCRGRTALAPQQRRPPCPPAQRSERWRTVALHAVFAATLRRQLLRLTRTAKHCAALADQRAWRRPRRGGVFEASALARAGLRTYDIACSPGLTFELSGRQRQDARPGLAKMYRVPPARAWWPAVGAPLERGVRRQCVQGRWSE
jgi:hypothetical protein